MLIPTARCALGVRASSQQKQQQQQQQQQWGVHFFVLLPFSHFFRFFVSSFLLFRLCLYVKPAANN